MKRSAYSCALLASAFSLFFASNVLAGQIDIHGPAGSGSFGTQTKVLPNGNFVVTDPSYNTDVGRAYLYNGKTLALISMMTGSSGDAIGNSVTVLANGDYVVTSPSWSGGKGAVTRCSATTGCPAAITSSNSLLGVSTNDNVGNSGTVALPSGSYVVISSSWNDGTHTNVGALTWCDGSAGCIGTISAANSRVGSHDGDFIGGGGIVVLANGNYISEDFYWAGRW